MANKTALGYVLDNDGKLIDAFIQCETATDPQPTAVELEIVRIVKEHRELKAEINRTRIKDAHMRGLNSKTMGDGCRTQDETHLEAEGAESAEGTVTIPGLQLKAKDEKGNDVTEPFKVKFIGPAAFGVINEYTTDKNFVELYAPANKDKIDRLTVENKAQAMRIKVLESLMKSSCFHPTEHPRFLEWFEMSGNDETSQNFDEWLIEQALKN